MHPMELAGVSPVMSRLPHDYPVVAAHSPNQIVLAIDRQEKFLTSVGRKLKSPDGTYAQSLAAIDDAALKRWEVRQNSNSP